MECLGRFMWIDHPQRLDNWILSNVKRSKAYVIYYRVHNIGCQSFYGLRHLDDVYGVDVWLCSIFGPMIGCSQRSLRCESLSVFCIVEGECSDVTSSDSVHSIASF